MSMRTHFICMLFRIHQFECIIFLKETLKFHAHENKWLHCKQNTDEKLISVNSLSTKKTVTTFKQEIKRQFFSFSDQNYKVLDLCELSSARKTVKPARYWLLKYVLKNRLRAWSTTSEQLRYTHTLLSDPSS